MSFKTETKTIYKCHCECINNDDTPCGHDWEADSLPERCPKCGRRTWNNVDGRRHNQPYTAHGKTQTLSQWAKQLGITTHAIKARIRSGMPVQQALTKGDMRLLDQKRKRRKKVS